MAATVDLKELIEHGVHFGHRTCFWEPKMAPYIYGKKSKDLHIINLLKTRPLMQKALNEMEAVAANNGKILFVSTKRIAQQAIEEAAEKCEMPSVSKRWPGGMLTNFKTILKSVKKMRQLEEFITTEAFSGMKKKERLSVQRELGKLQASFNGIRDMTSLPDMLFVIDVGHEHIAIKEAKKLGIPVIGVVDTNCSPEDIDYVIPGNDDSQKAINLYTRLASETVDVAREKIREKLKAAQVKMEGSTRVEVVKKAAKKADEKAVAEPTIAPGEETAAASTDVETKKPIVTAEKKIIRVAAKAKQQPKAEVAEPTKKPATRKKKTSEEADTVKSKKSSSATKKTTAGTDKTTAEKPTVAKKPATKKKASTTTTKSADKTATTSPVKAEKKSTAKKVTKKETAAESKTKGD
jgi:small subunit ribosomal protein S2